MIADGGTINCFGKCHSIKLNMGEYLLGSPVISIQMGCIYFVLGVHWLLSLGIMTFNFQYLFIRFSSQWKEIELRGIQGKPSKVIIFDSMKKILKTRHHGVIAQLCSLDVQTSISSTLVDLQILINNHSKVFGEIIKVIPPTRDHDHVIHLQPGSVAPNISPYKYLYAKKSEIKCTIQ
jgi:hypothetical protein